MVYGFSVGVECFTLIFYQNSFQPLFGIFKKKNTKQKYELFSSWRQHFSMYGKVKMKILKSKKGLMGENAFWLLFNIIRKVYNN